MHSTCPPAPTRGLRPGGRGGVLWVDPHLTAGLGVSRSALWGLWTCPHPPLLKRISPIRPEQPGEAARPPGGPVRSSLQRGDHAPQLCPPDAELGVLTLSEQRGWGSSGPSCPWPSTPASAAASTRHTHFTGEQTEGQRCRGRPTAHLGPDAHQTTLLPTTRRGRGCV